MLTPSFDVKILVEKVRIIHGYLRYICDAQNKYIAIQTSWSWVHPKQARLLAPRQNKTGRNSSHRVHKALRLRDTKQQMETTVAKHSVHHVMSSEKMRCSFAC